MELKFVMSTFIEDDFKVGLNCLKEVVSVGVSDAVLNDGHPKLVLAYCVDLPPQVRRSVSTAENHIQEVDDSDPFNLFLRGVFVVSGQN